jgi:hypothetical protein
MPHLDGESEQVMNQQKTCPRCKHQTESWANICEKCFLDFNPNKKVMYSDKSYIFGVLGSIIGLITIVFSIIVIMFANPGDGSRGLEFIYFLIFIGFMATVILFALQYGINN